MSEWLECVSRVVHQNNAYKGDDFMLTFVKCILKIRSVSLTRFGWLQKLVKKRVVFGCCGYAVFISPRELLLHVRHRLVW